MKTESLTAQQRKTYDETGYLVFPGVFNEKEVAEMAAEADRLGEYLINASIALDERSPRLDLARRQGTTVLRKVQPVIDLSDVFARYVSDERLIGPMRDLFGSEPIIMEEKLNYKQELPGSLNIEASADAEAFDYHTDWAYFSYQGYPRETLSSAVSIDECNMKNGPLLFLPGSHLRDWPQREGYPPLLIEGNVPEEEVIPILAPPGSVVIFHSCLVHASSDNQSGKPRRIMIFSHYPSSHEAEPDQRNKGLRQKGQDHEARYQKLLESGDYSPGYKLH